MADNELGLFLRSRREAVGPAQVGLPAGTRRRTPGLRRSEVAALAGVSVEYLTRLEQGRDRRPSPQVLVAIADTLRLTPNERVHLHRLSKSTDPGFSCRGPDSPPPTTVRPTVRALLQGFEPTAAALVSRLGDVVAHTAAYARLFGPLGVLDGRSPNLARFVLTDPRARTAYPDWAQVADHAVATLKEGPFRVDPHIAVLADELALVAGAEFTRRVEDVPSLPASNGLLRVVHPDAGPLRLAYETLDFPADDDLRLLAYLPADAATSSALDRLAGAGQPLRLVSS